jgi:hypothetical protein
MFNHLTLVQYPTFETTLKTIASLSPDNIGMSSELWMSER